MRIECPKKTADCTVFILFLSRNVREGCGFVDNFFYSLSVDNFIPPPYTLSSRGAEQ